MLESNATVSTANSQRLVNRLCKHWGHKFPVHLHDEGGDIELSLGHCALRHCEQGLEVRLRAEDEAALARLREVVADHLQRMAGDETLGFDWRG
ncbi:DUF2218 domain-containing protein [Stutzerimonas azotifigens]|uniref:DUF2218 domain-containing protein n=1 Tax=Stutzerimonas azotifigens TaxID=291995 RepID=UPI000400A917|nr:DUF2218 domain-containing protein [Stutzerimonas azotifigens]